MTTDANPASHSRLSSIDARVSRVRMVFGLFGAPAAWVIQMSLSEPIAAHACYPHEAPLTAPIWNSLPLMLAVISMVCLGVGLLSGFTAWTNWLRTRRDLSGDNEDVMEAGEGRRQFLSELGVLSSLIFVIAIIFTGCAVIFVSPCDSWF